MQAIVQDKYGSADVLHLKEIETPEIGDHDVLVRVRAAGVNPADWALMNGFPYIARPAPLYGLLKPHNPVRGNGPRRARRGRRSRRDAVHLRRRGLRYVSDPTRSFPSSAAEARWCRRSPRM